MGSLRIEDLGTGQADRTLPDNFLPMALEAIQDADHQAIYPLIGRVAAQDGDEDLLKSYDGALITLPISAEILRDVKFGPSTGFELETPLGRTEIKFGSIAVASSYLGPAERPFEATLRAPPDALPFSNRSDLSVLGLIDTGIAYWNPDLLRPDGSSRLESLSFIEYGPLTGRLPGPTSNTLASEELNQLLKKSQGPEGDRPLRRHFAARFPASVYAPFRGGPPAQPHAAFAHGTAMLDLLLRDPDDTRANGEVAVLGLELPANVLADASGAALESVAELAVDTLARKMRDLGNDAKQQVAGTILLPYAFVGGPHDGDRASLQGLKRLVTQYAGLGVKLAIVVPMGNHLDDRIHARLQRVGDDHPFLEWRILPDDHSANSVDLLYYGQTMVVELTAPDGSCVTFDGTTERIVTLKQDGRTIGAIRTEPKGNWMRTRISLGPTARRDEKLPTAQAGVWRLTMVQGDALNAWILRDDVTMASRALPPFRQSFFEDDAYARVDSAPNPVTDDDAVAATAIRRQGTVSLLATAAGLDDHGVGIEAVGAEWSRDGQSSSWSHGVHSGRYLPTNAGHGTWPAPLMEWVDRPRPLDGIHPMSETGGRPKATGGLRRFAVSGTSVAAAIRARKVAKNRVDSDGTR
jgi:hypothetical protein